MITTLARAKLENANNLKEISVASFKHGFELYGRYPPGIESLSWHQSEIEKGHYYEVRFGGELAGGVCVVPEDNREIFLKYLFISVNYQNKHIGSKVLALIEKQYAWAKQWRLLTPYKSFGNHYFYEKHGYVKVGEIQPDPNDEFKGFEYVKNK